MISLEQKKMKLHIPWNEIKVHELETLYYQVCVSSRKWDDINVCNLILLCRSPKPKSNPEQPVSIDLTVDDSPEQPSVMNGDESSYSLSQYNLEQNQRLLL